MFPEAGLGAAVADRIAAFLPGTTFDPGLHGVFQRRSRAPVHFRITDSSRSPVVRVAMSGFDDLMVVERLVSKDGWQAVDPATGSFADLGASRAHGRIIHLNVAAGLASPPEAASRRRTRGWWVALFVALALGVVWFRWSADLTPSTRDPVAAGADSLGSASRATSQGGAAPPSGATPVVAPRGAGLMAQAFDDEAASRAAQRQKRVKLLARELLTDPPPNALMDYLDASAGFSSLFFTDLHLKPRDLSDPALFEPFGGRAFLPLEFATPSRHEYSFDFRGECGIVHPQFPEFRDLCASFVYVARPLSPAVGKPSFALLSSDLRIHYRQDGLEPTEADPTVEPLGPSTAADLPGGTDLELSSEERRGVMGMLRRAFLAVVDWALGPGGRKQAAARLHESVALEDLRWFSVAETAFCERAGMGRFYLPPEALADAGRLQAAGLTPFLSGSFAQPLRLGYRYEFIGERPALAEEVPPGLPPVYVSFVYLARPEEPGPLGRRTFALYPDGLIFATTDGRVPSRRDAPVVVRR